jgi:phosphoribosylanthranilate isomerase
VSVQVKICGITQELDALAAANAGADAIGLVFWSGSKRAVSLEKAAEICSIIPPLLTVTALMVDPTAEEVEELLESLPINLIQWHGNEAPEFCEQWRVPYIKALPGHICGKLEAVMADYPGARGFLLDAVANGQFGGTGHRFDWDLIPSVRSRPIILAGGLNPANVAQAVTKVRPSAVDVSSGVECSPGIKQAEKIQQFISAAREAAEAVTL